MTKEETDSVIESTVEMCIVQVLDATEGIRVISLDLYSHKLVGSISPHIGKLSFLRVLDLTINSFNYEIPLKISHLRRLQMLFLRNNSLTSEIPTNISRCSIFHVYT